MSRYGRGRGGSVALPLDSNLFRENTNCPSAARSAGTVGKWGITSFTSIRSAPYAFANNVVKKPVQDQNHPLTVAPLETEAPPPKPKKFFKSRNVPDVPSTMPQPVFAPPVEARSRSPSPEYLPSNSSSRRRGHKAGRSPGGARDISPDPPRRNKHKPQTKAARKEEPSEAAHLSPNKRYLVRNRDKVINYAEDRSNSPIPDLSRTYAAPITAPAPLAAPPASVIPPVVLQVPVEVPVPLASPTVASPTYVKPGLVSPSSKDGKPPPIVLRISKGTSRIVSTDSNEGLTSPGSDRHSDSHYELDPKLSPAPDSMRSPKQEGLKITIKCSSFKDSSKRKEKKDRSEEKEGRSKAHKRNHRKSSDDEPLIRKVASPQPGTENYDLYRTLASPDRDNNDATDKSIKDKKEKSFEEIESEIAMLDSEEPVAKNSRMSPPRTTELAPDPKPPEKAGRAMRSRATINYNENDDGLIDEVTAGKITRNIPKPPKKSRRRAEALVAEIVAAQQAKALEEAAKSESAPPTDASELLNILSGENEKEMVDNELEPIKIKINKKHNQMNVQNKHSSPPPEENNCHGESPEQNDAHNSSPEPPVFKSPRNIDSVDDKPSVKLVITKKKGAIFKSKSLVNDSESSPLPARKRRHLYKHQWDDDGKGNQTPRREPEQPSEQQPTTEPAQVTELSRVTKYRAPEPTVRLPHEVEEEIEPYTSVRCPKGAKEYYTVVRNVKKAHQIQEIGEFQEFNDDVEYILDALKDNNPMSTRCLSAITLASKCTAPAFRMHVRAHGTVQKFFSALHDAANDQSLGLCTATVMFVLSQDRLNMDLDRESLELMLNLLESDVSHQNALDDCGLTSTQLAKNKERVRDLCAEIKSQGKATHLDLDNITVGHLAMETLLSLTSKRAGEWFKEELRVLGGVDHIVRTIRDCVDRLNREDTAEWTTELIDILRKADRCMRVLENVTQQNEENQLYLVTEGSESTRGVTGVLASMLQLCCRQARAAHPPAVHTALLDAALPTIKVLVNLSHNFTPTSTLGATVVGQNVSVMENCLIFLHNQGNFVPESKNFEFCVCVLLLLINLVQDNDANVMRLLDVSVPTHVGAGVVNTPAIHLLLDHFYMREELARLAEKNTDDILEGEKVEETPSDKKKQTHDDMEETVAKLLAKAGAHMEHSMVGAYLVLLLGHAGARSPALARAVRALSRERDYSLLLAVLRKYASFVNLTASAEAASVAHIKSTNRIIQFLEESDREQAAPALASPAAPAAYQPPPASPSDLPRDMSLSNLSGSDNSYN